MTAGPALDLTVRVGCKLQYETIVPTPVLFVLKPRLDGRQLIKAEKLSFGSSMPPEEFEDSQGSITYRTELQPGRTEIQHDALVAVSSQPDNFGFQDEALPVGQLPTELLKYTLPSRYCDSDKLFQFAWQQFKGLPPGVELVQAICDWVHTHVEYRFGSGRSDITASEIIQRGYGVCRDFAHVAVALCRCFNLPTRYVTGHLPDIGYQDPGTSMDFHAYMEVFIGTRWYTFDARYNVARIGRVKVAHGLDAVHGAFATLYGAAQLTKFEVWAYQVNPEQVNVGDPINLNLRLDGTEEVRFA